MKVGAIIYNNNKVLLLKEKSKWNLPMGDINKNEGIKESTLKQLLVITGYATEIKDFAGIYTTATKDGAQEEVAIFVAKPLSELPKKTKFSTRWVEIDELENLRLSHNEIVDVVKNALEDQIEQEHVVLF